MRWKPTLRAAYAVPVARVVCVGDTCLLMPERNPVMVFSLVPTLQATWRYLFRMRPDASPQVQGEYWSLLIQNGIEIQ